MSSKLNENARYQLAKSLTELAVQNGLVYRHEEPSDTAKEVVKFFDTIYNNIGKSE